MKLLVIYFMKIFVLLFALLSFTSGWRAKKSKVEINSPVVIVPGTGGSQLQAKLVGKPSKPHWYCSSKTSDYFMLWLRIESLLPFGIDCWVDNMRLVWNLNSMTVSNAPGVVTRVLGFGDTDTVEHLDSSGLVKYMKPLVDFLVSKGYKRGASVRAAPYDFRYAPRHTPEDYQNKLKELIEKTYSMNGDKKVTLVSHSYGCPISLYFLHSMTQQWKDKYIKQWFTISGVFGGTMKQILLYASGDTMGIPNFLVNPIKVRGEQRTSTSNLFMLPVKDVWDKSEVLVKTSKRSYTIEDIPQFLKDVGFPQGVKMREHVGDTSSLFKAPGVPVYCMYANTPESTEETLEYAEGEFPDSPSKVVKGNGDGTVNLRSLELCKKFANLQSQKVVTVAVPGQDHNGMLSDDNVLKALEQQLFN